MDIALSHWCIFHRSKAELVVATWDKQFRSSDMARKVPLLYLANDILQNSKRKGNEFVTEFWKVLPSALKEVVDKGDDRGKTVVSRLVSFSTVLHEYSKWKSWLFVCFCFMKMFRDLDRALKFLDYHFIYCLVWFLTCEHQTIEVVDLVYEWSKCSTMMSSLGWDMGRETSFWFPS